MELLEVINSRRSIRKFKSDAIPENYINELLNSGRLAPSGVNIQPTRYVIIKSEEARGNLKECCPLPFVWQAPVVIGVCTDITSLGSTETRARELREANAFVDTPLDEDAHSNSETNNKKKEPMDEGTLRAYLNLNAAIAIDHITLRAVDLGLGSCWVMMFDKAKLREQLKLEERYDVVALIPIGYPDQAPSQRPRLSVDEILLKEM